MGRNATPCSFITLEATGATLTSAHATRAACSEIVVPGPSPPRQLHTPEGGGTCPEFGRTVISSPPRFFSSTDCLANPSRVNPASPPPAPRNICPAWTTSRTPFYLGRSDPSTVQVTVFNIQSGLAADSVGAPRLMDNLPPPRPGPFRPSTDFHQPSHWWDTILAILARRRPAGSRPGG